MQSKCRIRGRNYFSSPESSDIYPEHMDNNPPEGSTS